MKEELTKKVSVCHNQSWIIQLLMMIDYFLSLDLVITVSLTKETKSLRDVCRSIKKRWKSHQGPYFCGWGNDLLKTLVKKWIILQYLLAL